MSPQFHRIAILLLAVVIASTVELTAQNPLEFTWRPAPHISPGRYYHTETMLPDHRLLVTGGRRGFKQLESMAIYDPTQNGGIGAWMAFEDMFRRRERHQATLMPQGWVLISGGLDNDVPTNQCELVDPAQQQHQLLPNMNEARYEHTTTLLPGGKVLAIGSKDYDRGLPTCEIFEPLEVAHSSAPMWRWRRTGSMQFGRGKHRAVRLLDGRVLVIGGVHNYRPTQTCEAFNIVTEQWTQVAPMWTKREGHTATLLPDGRVLVTGGDEGGMELTTCELFDPWVNGGYGEWTRLPSTLYARKNHTATLVEGRYLIVTGAWRAGQGDRSTEVLDTQAFPPQWHLGPTMLEDRSNHSATLLGNGHLLLIGGELFGMQEATTACDLSDITLALESQHSLGFEISGPMPNPFAVDVLITVDIPWSAHTRVVVADCLGREVRQLHEGMVASGRLTLRWDGRGNGGSSLPNGAYFFLIDCGSTHVIRAVHLLR